MSRQSQNEGKLVIAIDFGTTFSGVAYGSSRLTSEKLDSSFILFLQHKQLKISQIPTCLLYDEYGHVVTWGFEAKHAIVHPEMTRYEWFKLFLDPRALQDESAPDPRLPLLRPGKTATDLITDFLRCLWEYAREQIRLDIGATVADFNTAHVFMTDSSREHTKGDIAWGDRLKIITEPEAAAVHCAHLTDLYKLLPLQKFLVCDAGGGTVDLAVYEITGNVAHLDIAQITASSGADCGSLFLDLRFRALVEALLVDHPTHLDPASLGYFSHSFAETDKLNYSGTKDDDTIFYFNCFNVTDPDDRLAGLVNGQLAIPGKLLREAVFDPVVDEVLELITKQLDSLPTIDALLLVGGFSCCAYLKARVEEQFGAKIRLLVRPPDSDTATLRGAARYALERPHLVVQRSYYAVEALKDALPIAPERSLLPPPYMPIDGLPTKDLRDALRACEQRLYTSILAVLGSRDAKNAVLLLEDTRAQLFLDALQDVLERGSLPSAERTSQARRLILRLSEAHDQLPSSLFITGVIDRDEHPTFGGGFGDIFRASYNGGTVALKRIRIFTATADAQRNRLQFCREALLWQTLRHKYILPLIGIDREAFPSSFCMVAPWMKHGTVLKYLNEHGRARADKLLLQVAEGLSYLHSKNIVHGDLRGMNILVSDDWNACLADFGLTSAIAETALTTGSALTSTSNHAGSVRWFAPELIASATFGCERFARTKASDVYAFGCVCLELHTGGPPFSDVSPEVAAMLKVVAGDRPSRPNVSISDTLWALVTAAWAQDFRDRPNIAEIAESMRALV
ncbi:kinase-like domain-containing protein [Mycena epipterygia]|nr:kinase-like domain-containing protein [Mycena epipterygia]